MKRPTITDNYKARARESLRMLLKPGSTLYYRQIDARSVSTGWLGDYVFFVIDDTKRFRNETIIQEVTAYVCHIFGRLRTERRSALATNSVDQYLYHLPGKIFTVEEIEAYIADNPDVRDYGQPVSNSHRMIETYKLP